MDRDRRGNGTTFKRASLALVAGLLLVACAADVPASVGSDQSNLGPATSFGKTAVGSDWLTSSTDYKRASKFALSQPNVSVSKLVAYVDGLGATSGTQIAQGIVYADDGVGGLPGTRLCTTGSVVVAANAAARWVDLPVAGTCRLGTAGNYWLGLQTGGPATGLLRYSVSASPGGLQHNRDAFSDGAATPFGAPSSSDSELSIYAEYSVSGAGGPSVAWSTPSNGQTVSGVLNETNGNCEALVTSTQPVDRVEFYLDGALLNTERYAAYACAWDTSTAASGSHTLRAVAYDTAGGSASASIQVNVAGAAPAAPGAPAAKADFWVATTGSDSNPGTSDRPFKTIQRAVDAAQAGNTIVVRDGTYGPTTGCSGGTGYAVWIDKAATASAPITVKAEHKGAAVLDSQNVCHSYFYVANASYWEIQGFRILNGAWGGMINNSPYVAHHITVRGNEIASSGRRAEDSTAGIVGVYTWASSHDWTFDGNTFHDIGRTSGLYMNNDHGLYLHSQSSTIINNVFRQPISGWGVQTASGFSGVIVNNTFHGHMASDRAGQIVLWDPNGAVTIRNNVFYDPKYAAIAIAGWSPSSCAIDHNLVFGAGITSITDQTTSCAVSANRFGIDPMFVNAPSDLHLRAGSPAIDTGVPFAAVTTDIDGQPRPRGAGYDVGADEQ